MKKKLTMSASRFVLAVRFIQYLILLDLGARPWRGNKGRRPPHGLCRSKCLAVASDKRINILGLTIPLIATKNTSDINLIGRMAEDLIRERGRGRSVDVQPLITDARRQNAEWGRILQLFAEEEIRPRDVLIKRSHRRR